MFKTAYRPAGSVAPDMLVSRETSGLRRGYSSGVSIVQWYSPSASPHSAHGIVRPHSEVGVLSQGSDGRSRRHWGAQSSQ